MSSFTDLGLSPQLLQAVTALGYDHPTPIQEAAIPLALAGRDILGCAQTGTGKTASFTLPLLQRLHNEGGNERGPRPRALILVPTRELGDQIIASLAAYGKNLPLRCGLIIGGVGQRPQEVMLRRGVDIIVATPGRLIDHMQRNTVSLRELRFLVLDEADRMLDMGFAPAIRTIMKMVPNERQTMLFSATLPESIMALTRTLLHNPAKVEVGRRSCPAQTVTQLMYPVAQPGKRAFLLQLLEGPEMTQVVVFTRTKRGANHLAEHLSSHGHRSAAFHGNKSQSQRRAVLERFRRGNVRVLVATDIAARGLDVAGVSHVVNYEMPEVAEDYIHRIGRTGRAEATGIAISLVDGRERPLLSAIERLVGKKLVCPTAQRSVRPVQAGGAVAAMY